ncbi:SOS response associated peptidase (SRAP), partial [bacterium A37T11]
MCWDISLHTDIELTKAAFPNLKIRSKIQWNPNMEDVWALGHPEYPIIMREESGLALDDAEWGVDPVYLMKDPKKYADMRKNMVNARSERILEDKRSMWYRLRKNRCLIPVSGTFEHRHINGWKKKVPYF